MSYNNNRFIPQHNFSNPLNSFVPFCQQAGQMFNFPGPFGPLPPLASSLFPPNLLIQQQNNYYNSTVAPHSLFPSSSHAQMLPHGLSSYLSWPARSNLAKSQVIPPQKSRKAPEIICLDQESLDNVVVIEDSQPEGVVPAALKNEPKVQPQLQKSQLKLQVQKQVKQRGFLSEVKKNEAELLPQKRQNRVVKYALQVGVEKKVAEQAKVAIEKGALEKKTGDESKVAKKKTITKEKFYYKLSSHEKHLAELSEYRQFFPHETVTGPQFQAKLPHLRLFNSNFRSIPEKESWLRVRREKLLERLQGVPYK